MAQKTITLTDVRIGNWTVWKNEQGKWMLRAHYDVLDDAGKVRGGDWVEYEPAADTQEQVQVLADALTAQVREREGI